MAQAVTFGSRFPVKYTTRPSRLPRRGTAPLDDTSRWTSKDNSKLDSGGCGSQLGSQAQIADFVALEPRSLFSQFLSHDIAKSHPSYARESISQLGAQL